MYRPVKEGTLTQVRVPWKKTFVIIPRRTINRQWVWFGQAYVRRVWRYIGLTDEPFTEFGTLFDVINDQEEPIYEDDTPNFPNGNTTVE